MTEPNPEDCFTLIREIGAGSFGKCFLCTRQTDGSKIVIKKVALTDEQSKGQLIMTYWIIKT